MPSRATLPGDGTAGAPPPRPGTSPDAPPVHVGNANVDAPPDRGWLLGHFKDPSDPRHSEDVEIKWGMHAPGDRRADWVRGEARTALLVLVSGRFRVELPDRTVVLGRPGDYVVWGRGTDHSWYAEEESVVLTVRWPSVPGYAVVAAASPDTRP
ncbi:signal peptidase I [Streptomyces fuscigenes]|uniref:signal peptidase I n=1 Tax=Streptomyces fuscigenes TaxID=1528880 RepID=UPI001F21E722|nr:signal peptidase I [Streptomyces fuscigenes]MCF3962457.1 signal peptidase I [Streptomyces fuscigenes]